MQDLSAGEARAVFTAAPDGIVIVDDEGTIRHLNPAMERLFGYSREELVGQPVERLVPETARDAHVGKRLAFQEDPEARPMGIGLELRGRRKDGTEFPVEISLSPLAREEGGLVIATVRDVTTRRRLREFGAGALRAAEEERRRIARELHDDAVQRLAALLIRLRLARRAESDERRDEILEEVHREILDTAEALRRTARGLRPPALEDAGVVAAIRSYARGLTETRGLHIEIDAAPVEDRLEPDSKLALYRIVQESLSNVVRHSGAERAWILIERSPDRVVVTVRDDGSGFDVNGFGSAGGKGLGLLGMQERASIVSARLDVQSEPGQGTEVRLEIPTH